MIEEIREPSPVRMHVPDVGVALQRESGKDNFRPLPTLRVIVLRWWPIVAIGVTRLQARDLGFLDQHHGRHAILGKRGKPFSGVVEDVEQVLWPKVVLRVIGEKEATADLLPVGHQGQDFGR